VRKRFHKIPVSDTNHSFIVEICDAVRRRTNSTFAMPVSFYLRFVANKSIPLIVGKTVSPSLKQFLNTVLKIDSGKS